MPVVCGSIARRTAVVCWLGKLQGQDRQRGLPKVIRKVSNLQPPLATSINVLGEDAGGTQLFLAPRTPHLPHFDG